MRPVDSPLKGLLRLAETHGNAAIVLTIVASVFFGIIGATVWNIILHGIWTEIGAAFFQGVLSGVSIFVAVWLLGKEDRMTRRRDEEIARQTAVQKQRNELIFTYGIIDSVMSLFKQIFVSSTNKNEFDDYKNLYQNLLNQELSYLNSVNLMEMTSDDNIMAISNMRKLSIAMLDLFARPVFDIARAADLVDHLKEHTTEIMQAKDALAEGGE